MNHATPAADDQANTAFIVVKHATIKTLRSRNLAITYSLIAGFARRKGYCYSSYDYLAELLDVSRRQLLREVADLRNSGAIRIEHPDPHTSPHIFPLLSDVTTDNPEQLRGDVTVTPETHPRGDTYVTPGVTQLNRRGDTYVTSENPTLPENPSQNTEYSDLKNSDNKEKENIKNKKREDKPHSHSDLNLSFDFVLTDEMRDLAVDAGVDADQQFNIFILRKREALSHLSIDEVLRDWKIWLQRAVVYQASHPTTTPWPFPSAFEPTPQMLNQAAVEGVRGEKAFAEWENKCLANPHTMRHADWQAAWFDWLVECKCHRPWLLTPRGRFQNNGSSEQIQLDDGKVLTLYGPAKLLAIGRRQPEPNLTSAQRDYELKKFPRKSAFVKSS